MHIQRTTPTKYIFFFASLAIQAALFFAYPPSSAGQQPAASASANTPKTAETVPSYNKSTTPVVVTVVVNTVPKGDFFVELDAAGDLFIKTEDLDALQLKFAQDRIVLIHNERYAPANAVLDATAAFDERNLSLSFIGKTMESEKTSMDVFALQYKPQNVYYPHETSAFINYGLNYAHTDPLGSWSFSATNKVGARSGDVFFVSDSLYTKTETDQKFVRLQSSATYERRNDLQWLVMGDQFVSSGDLGSSVNMGGLGFSKVYKLDPYFITQPVFDLKGTVIYPTQADIYLDGVFVGKQQIAPGSFDLKNIYSYSGSHRVEVVLKDPFGNEQRIAYPVYFNTFMLREGLQEYSYNVGFIRQQYGLMSDDYGKPVFSAFHRYGVTNALNIGARAEGSDGVYNGGLSTAFAVPRVGAFTFSLAESDANGAKGSAGSFQHAFQRGSFSTNVLIRGFSRDYATVSAPTTSTPEQIRYEASLGMGFLLNRLGSVSLNYSETKTYGNMNTRVASANYSRTLSRTTSLFATASETQRPAASYSFFLGLSFNFDNNLHGALQYSKAGETTAENAQIQKDVPVGEGLGYRAVLNRTDTGTTASNAFNPFVQYNARYGIYSADSTVQQSAGNTSEMYNLSAAGALVYAGGFYGLSRPVNDSFSIVMLDKVANAKVLNNGQAIGTTGASGKLIVPTLTSYGQNQITVDVKNLPMDYSISGVNKALSPSLWSGSCVAFDAKKVRALTGTLYAQTNGKKIPLEYVDITMKVGAHEQTFPTGKGGEFYIENSIPDDVKTGTEDPQSCRAIAERRKTGGNVIQPGTYPASVEFTGGKCTFSVTFPDTEDVITDLGDVRCISMVTPTAPVEKATSAPKPSPNRDASEARSAAPDSNSPRSFALNVSFGQDGAPTTSVGRAALADIARMLADNPELSVEIEGHGDRHGSEAVSARLALLRAERTKRYLLKAGVKPEQIKKVESIGRKQPVCTEDTAACDEMNRIVVIKIVPRRGADRGGLERVS